MPRWGARNLQLLLPTPDLHIETETSAGQLSSYSINLPIFLQARDVLVFIGKGGILKGWFASIEDKRVPGYTNPERSSAGHR